MKKLFWSVVVLMILAIIAMMVFGRHHNASRAIVPAEQVVSSELSTPPVGSMEVSGGNVSATKVVENDPWKKHLKVMADQEAQEKAEEISALEEVKSHWGSMFDTNTLPVDLKPYASYIISNLRLERDNGDREGRKRILASLGPELGEKYDQWLSERLSLGRVNAPSVNFRPLIVTFSTNSF